MTPQEIMVWKYLKNSNMGYKFRRQHSINFYIVDFCCPERKVIVEIDGSQHLQNKEYDAERTRNLEAYGYVVLRFWNSEVNNNLGEVLEKIKRCAEKRSPREIRPPRPAGTPPFQGGEPSR